MPGLNTAQGNLHTARPGIEGRIGERSVLVVDDEQGIRTALTAHFTRMGWQVKTAATVREAEIRLAQDRFDLMVCDVRLTDGSGTALLSHPDAPAIPAVLLTAFGSVPDAVEAMRSGAADYLTKPVAWPRLEALAKRLAERGPMQGGELRVGAAAGYGTSSGISPSGTTAVTVPVVPPGLPIRELERLHLEQTLELTRGNRTHAAEMLGISLRTMRNKIREYGLPPRSYA